MEEIKECVFSICVASVCGFILNMILPKDDYKKLLKIIISVFILSSILSPILSMKNNIKIPDFNFEHNETENNFSYELLENTKREIENNLKEKCEIILNDNKINFKDVNIDIKINEDSDIEINEFFIETSASNAPEIKNIIKENFGFEPEILFSEE